MINRTSIGVGLWLVCALFIVASAGDSYAFDCQTSCESEAFQTCTSRPSFDLQSGQMKATEYCTLDFVRSTECRQIKMFHCQSNFMNTPLIHGNYCGLGSKDPSFALPAVDAFDEACKRHDMCYQDRDLFACSCDRPFADEALAASRNVTGSAKGKALYAHFFFMNVPCTD